MTSTQQLLDETSDLHKTLLLLCDDLENTDQNDSQEQVEGRKELDRDTCTDTKQDLDKSLPKSHAPKQAGANKAESETPEVDAGSNTTSEDELDMLIAQDNRDKFITLSTVGFDSDSSGQCERNIEEADATLLWTNANDLGGTCESGSDSEEVDSDILESDLDEDVSQNSTIKENDLPLKEIVIPRNSESSKLTEESCASATFSRSTLIVSCDSPLHDVSYVSSKEKTVCMTEGDRSREVLIPKELLPRKRFLKLEETGEFTQTPKRQRTTLPDPQYSATCTTLSPIPAVLTRLPSSSSGTDDLQTPIIHGKFQFSNCLQSAACNSTPLPDGVENCKKSSGPDCVAKKSFWTSSHPSSDTALALGVSSLSESDFSGFSEEAMVTHDELLAELTALCEEGKKEELSALTDVSSIKTDNKLSKIDIESFFCPDPQSTVRPFESKLDISKMAATSIGGKTSEIQNTIADEGKQEGRFKNVDCSNLSTRLSESQDEEDDDELDLTEDILGLDDYDEDSDLENTLLECPKQSSEDSPSDTTMISEVKSSEKAISSVTSTGFRSATKDIDAEVALEKEAASKDKDAEVALEKEALTKSDETPVASEREAPTKADDTAMALEKEAVNPGITVSGSRRSSCDAPDGQTANQELVLKPAASIEQTATEKEGKRENSKETGVVVQEATKTIVLEFFSRSMVSATAETEKKIGKVEPMTKRPAVQQDGKGAGVNGDGSTSHLASISGMSVQKDMIRDENALMREVRQRWRSDGIPNPDVNLTVAVAARQAGRKSGKETPGILEGAKLCCLNLLEMDENGNRMGDRTSAGLTVKETLQKLYRQKASIEQEKRDRLFQIRQEVDEWQESMKQKHSFQLRELDLRQEMELRQLNSLPVGNIFLLQNNLMIISHEHGWQKEQMRSHHVQERRQLYADLDAVLDDNVQMFAVKLKPVEEMIQSLESQDLTNAQLKGGAHVTVKLRKAPCLGHKTSSLVEVCLPAEVADAVLIEDGIYNHFYQY